MPKLIIAILGAALLGALSLANKKRDARRAALPEKENVNRWEVGNGNTLPSANVKG